MRTRPRLVSHPNTIKTAAQPFDLQQRMYARTAIDIYTAVNRPWGSYTHPRGVILTQRVVYYNGTSTMSEIAGVLVSDFKNAFFILYYL